MPPDKGILSNMTIAPINQGNDNIALSILVPVRNDGINLEVFIKVLETMVETPHEVLIVHDTPDDDSIPVVLKIRNKYPNVRLVHNTLGRGVINAIKAGVNASVGEVILITVCDELGIVLVFEDMLALIHQGCDLVSGTRYAHGGRRLGGSWIGRLLSKSANRLLSSLCGSMLTDATTGLKMFRRSVFDSFDLEARPIGWAVVFEMGLKAQLAGLRLGEVPVISIDRLYGGKSTFKLGSWFVEYLRWFIWGALPLRRSCRKSSSTVAVRIPSTTARQ
jgi:glycosyltransferase involved in cell wall biosynthesis